MLLSAYDYSLKYRRGSENGNADALSRLPTVATIDEVSDMTLDVNMVKMDRAPVTADDVSKETRRDVILSRVHDMILQGWTEQDEVSETYKPFVLRKNELSVEGGTVLWGNRLVIPTSLRKQVLEQLHEAHTGVCKMKALARCYVWWPKMDKDIEKVTSSCVSCLENRSSPEKSPVHAWEQPNGVWERLHIDYAGPFLGKMFLIVVDAYSKWLEVYVTRGSTSSETVEKLRHSFAIHGIPRVLVSDNGTSFVSQEFASFCKKNGIRHVTSAPYHPSTNGLAERSVRTFKEAMKKWKNDGDSTETKVERFLFAYRNTPHAVTGLSPAQVLLKRRPLTSLSKLKLARKDEVGRDCGRQPRKFQVGDAVMTRNYARGEKWMPGVVSRETGPLSYHVEVGGGIVRRHVDQVISRDSQREEVIEVTSEDEGDNNVTDPECVEEKEELGLQADQAREDQIPPPEALPTSQSDGGVQLRRSSRTRKKPAWMEGYC